MFTALLPHKRSVVSLLLLALLLLLIPLLLNLTHSQVLRLLLLSWFYERFLHPLDTTISSFS
jgi:hypothetical protein